MLNNIIGALGFYWVVVVVEVGFGWSEQSLRLSTGWKEGFDVS